jgi:hypothetical protein
MISFDTNLLLYSLNQDCAEYNDAHASSWHSARGLAHSKTLARWRGRSKPRQRFGLR